MVRLLPTPTTEDHGTDAPNRVGSPSLSTDFVTRNLLPTPRATDGTKGGPNQRGSSGDLMLPSAVQQLLPTPTAMDALGSRNSTAWRSDPDKPVNIGDTLTDFAWKHEGHVDPRLLPTPSVADAMGGHLSRSGDRSNELLLPGVAKEIANGNADPARAGEGLRDVRDADGAEALQRTTGGPGSVHATPALLPELREHPCRGDEGRAPLEGAAAQVRHLLRMRDARAAARSSQGPEPGEQLTREPRHPVCVMPPAPALAGGPRCPYGCGQTCSGHSTVVWGEYEAAIRRWEVRSGRPAPGPTEPGRNGAPRLSAHFVEFLMGLPAGHVTDPDIGLTRNAQLKALGNGVVPQQAAEATRWWLAQVEAVSA